MSGVVLRNHEDVRAAEEVSRFRVADPLLEA